MDATNLYPLNHERNFNLLNITVNIIDEMFDDVYYYYIIDAIKTMNKKFLLKHLKNKNDYELVEFLQPLVNELYKYDYETTPWERNGF